MISIRVFGLTQAMAKLQEIGARLQKPQRGLEAATNKIAGVFAINYDGQGSLVGGWPELAERTAAMRDWQGYDPYHPIMLRYGALRAVAVEFFETAKSGEAISAGDDYSDQDVSGSLIVSGKQARLSVGGSYKVLNQDGYSNTNGSGDNPARPFWFVSKESVAAGVEAITKWIEDEVLV